MILGHSKMRWKRSLVLYCFMAPAILCWLFFRYVPMYGLIMAFKDFSPTLGFMDSPWVGFKHFENFFGSVYFGRLFKNTFLISLYTLLWGFPLPILLAIVFNELRFKKWRSLFQTISYMPNFLSLVVVCSFVFNFTRMDTGIINIVLKLMGLEQHAFMSDPECFRTIYVVSQVWQTVGWSSIVYYAALSSVDPNLLEAAQMDGCGRIKRIWYISLPMIKPTVVTLLLLEVGKLLNVGYEKIFLLYNAGTYVTADVFSTYTYRMAFASNQLSYAAAVGLFENVVRAVIMIIANQISKKIAQESLW